jgi:hypothetical protein
MMRLFMGAIYLIFGLVLVASGLRNAQKLVDVVASRGGFTQSAGVIEEVIKHDNPVYESTDHAGIPFLAEVKFAYTVNGTRFVSNTLSASCTLCSPKDVLDVTGFRPGKLPPGTRVAVFFKPGKPELAYLVLSSNSDVLREVGFTLLWLVIAPLFVYWHFGMWTAGKPESAPDD